MQGLTLSQLSYLDLPFTRSSRQHLARMKEREAPQPVYTDATRSTVPSEFAPVYAIKTARAREYGCCFSASLQRLLPGADPLHRCAAQQHYATLFSDSCICAKEHTHKNNSASTCANLLASSGEFLCDRLCISDLRIPPLKQKKKTYK